MLKSRRWGPSKPPAGVEINLAHPLARDLRAAWLLGEGGGLLTTDAVWGMPGLFNGLTGSAWQTGPGGPGVELVGTVAIDWPIDARLRPSALPVSWATGIVTLATSSAIANDNSSGGSVFRGTWYGYDAAGLFVHFGDGGTPTSSSRRTKTGSTVLPVNRYLHVGASLRGNTDMSLYLNGIDDGGTYSGSGAGLSYSATNAGRIGRYNVSGVQFNPSIGVTYCYYWHRNVRPEEYLWLAAEPYAFFQPITKRRYFLGPPPAEAGDPEFGPTMPGGGPIGSGPIGEPPDAGGGGTLVEISMAGAITAAGAFASAPHKTFAGAVPSSGVLQKQPSLEVEGSSTLAGALTQQLTRLFTGVITGSSTLAMIRAQSISMAGSLGLTGALQRVIALPETAVIGLTGVLLKLVQPFVAWEGALFPEGLLQRVLSRQPETGTITPTGTLEQQAASTIALDGVLDLAGTATGTPIKAMTGTVTAGGVLTKQIEKNTFEGFLMSLGELLLVREQTLEADGTITPTGELRKTIPFPVFAGELTLTGLLGHVLAQTMTGTITGVGTYSRTIVQQLALAGAVVLSGVLTTSVVLGRLFTGTLQLAGSLIQTAADVSALGLVTMVRPALRAAGMIQSALRAMGFTKPRVR